MKKKTAILIVAANADPTGLAVGQIITGSGSMGRVSMKITSVKQQTAFADQPFVLEVATREPTWFDDANPITTISYNNERNRADVTTCTFTS
ncbi:hypothetical protein KDX32_13770 [Burkholderia ambifaria]|jgi:hypothetical protein|uniref:hypothetical protein n=1 Tax=Burkholderia TaxID=32008 RepID=UPI00110D346A|nr:MULTISPECIES: hypothetical protein [Burkholderia]MBR8064157.1 hypothetical protein [Burkholderia ambifaria]QDW53494.1 hypothetical protein FFI87_025055 [Burkholderia sp. KBS0801]